MATMQEFEVWMLIDENGDAEVGTSEEICVERYEGNISTNHGLGRRMVKVRVSVPLPEIIELAVEAADDAEATAEAS